MDSFKCLTCKYEPVWSLPIAEGKPAERRMGACRWKGAIPKLPAVYRLDRSRTVIRYRDDSGIPTICETWEKKDDE